MNPYQSPIETNDNAKKLDFWHPVGMRITGAVLLLNFPVGFGIRMAMDGGTYFDVLKTVSVLLVIQIASVFGAALWMASLDK